MNTYFRRTRQMGAAAQVITLVSGLQVVRYEPLVAAAGELGIDDALLERSLSELEEMDQIRIVKSRDGNHRIEVRTRRTEDRYSVIGERWTDLQPSHIEQIALDVLDRLALLPQPQDELQDRYDLSSTDFDIVLNVMTSSGTIGSTVSSRDARTVLYSPLYWEDHPDRLPALPDDMSASEVADAIAEVRNYQGLPATRVNNPTLLAVSATGLLPAVTVASAGGTRQFLFTPQQGVKRVDRTVLKKAYALLACLRYGQHHAVASRLHWAPADVLQLLKDRKRFGRHSEAPMQYSPLVELMIGRVERVEANRYTFILEDTDENMEAIDLAIKLASMGEGISSRGTAGSAAAQLLLPSASFKDQARTRIDIKRGVRADRNSTSRISAIISGVSGDII